ncbi:MAG: NADH-quinone oxidoreductase subunit F, partial [Anaerolineae bacterium]|nr:NADH-quinone oxidoreductase subunit F [Anaerolineae bacterium]
MEALQKIQCPEDLTRLREALVGDRDPNKPCITVCSGTGCQAYGCQQLTDAFRKELERRGLTDAVDIRTTGCHGFCERGPVVVIKPEGVFYQRMEVGDVAEVVEETLVNKRIVDRLLYTAPVTAEKIVHEHDVPFYKLQTRLILGNNGLIDPTSIEDYIAVGGYSALVKALYTMEPEEIIEAVKKSGLRGRGGGGFPTGRKWESCRRAEGDTRYVICNADEGDPGAYMDRSVLEGTPHSVLEGMIIGAYAIGSHEGYIYVRYEYPLAVQ